LNRLARQTGRTESYDAQRAIEEFLDKQEDCFIALARLEDDLPSIP